MKIQSSTIAMASSYSKQEVTKKEETVQTWVGDRSGQNNGQRLSTPADTLELSQEGKQKSDIAKTDVQKTQYEEGFSITISDKDRQKIQLLQAMLEKLTGRKFKFAALEEIPIKNNSISFSMPNNQNATAPASQGWGLIYNARETHIEKEAMNFSSSGSIQTADGKSINFDVSLNMSRSFSTQKEINIRAGDAAIDPLVINFDGKAPSLTDKKFSFDIDANGTSDQISFLQNGSGFLALDQNSDGKINNGKELFGPNSGNGFSELKQFDADNNNWIDENDQIYDKLRIWTKDENGNDQLFALGQKGIGAIYLGNVATPFEMNNANNDTQGNMRASGIFVRENGTVGTVSEIDLVV